MFEENLNEIEESKKKEGCKPKKKVIIPIVLICLAILGVLVYFIFFHSSKKDKKEDEKIFTYKFPFTLNFAPSDNRVMPLQISDGFEESNSYEIIDTGFEAQFGFSAYMLDSERYAQFGININPDSESFKLIAGGSYDFEKVSGDINFYQKTKSKKIAVNYYVKKYTILFDIEKITLKKKFIDKISDILKDTQTVKDEKVNKLIELFDQYGYFVPLQMDLGGRFIYTFEESDMARANDISYNIFNILEGRHAKNISEYGKAINVHIVGGEPVRDCFNYSVVNEWIKSLNDSNYAAINYNTFVKLPQFLPIELKELYSQVSKDVDKRFSILYEKYQILKHYSDIDVPTDEIYGQYTKEYSYGASADTPYVQVKEFHVSKDATVGRTYVTQRFDCKLKQVIVGFKITEEREDFDVGGYWTAKFNPILKKSIEIYFKSCVSREQKWGLYIYYLDFN